MMAVTVLIPTPLRKLTAEQASVSIDGATVSDVLANLGVAYPEITKRLFDDSGELRRFVNVYVNGDDIRLDGDGTATSVKEGDEVSIVPAIAGGM
jgi:sulfur-carrier protein